MIINYLNYFFPEITLIDSFKNKHINNLSLNKLLVI